MSRFQTLLDALEAERIPVQPGGRTYLFLQEDADLFGRTVCWLSDFDWRVSDYGWEVEAVTLDDLAKRYRDQYGLGHAQTKEIRAYLESWKARVDDAEPDQPVWSRVLRAVRKLGVDAWDLDDECEREPARHAGALFAADSPTTRRQPSLATRPQTSQASQKGAPGPRA